ncbi:uncharacterized protein [Nicotiana tomentosiformis]|uniref:uncharacterized protein n=1 Tax=Nicotiana tomentosiformis TaxID=4098 RepID=UPI00388C810B
MLKYWKPCKKQGHSEVECWVIHPELHKRIEEGVEEQSKEKAVVVSSDAIGTAANSTKVLTSGKVVGKPITNHAKQEWMQSRKNKYQRDNRGHIVDNKQGKEVDNGKGEDHSNGKKKEHGEKQAKKGQEKEKKVNTQEEHKRVKKEAVEKVVENEHNGNPIHSGIQSSAPKDDQELAKANSSIPSDQRTDERANKESTIDWIEIPQTNEELKQLNVTTNQSCHEIPSQTFNDSGQIEDLDEVNSTKVLWSDAVEVNDDQLGTTKTTEVKVKKDNKPSFTWR